jgi:hypothetical protein
MATQQTLRPFRDYNEKDVINLFTVSGAPIDTTYNIIATKGSIVKIVGSGFVNDINDPEGMIGNMGLYNVNNFVGQRYGANAFVALANSGDTAIGMTLFDVRELDENGEFLKYRPQKAAEMEAVLSGQVVPIVTRGRFIISGIQTGNGFGGVGTAITAGSPIYVGTNGAIATSYNTGVLTNPPVIGHFLGTAGWPYGTGGSTASQNSYGDSTTTALVQLSIA